MSHPVPVAVVGTGHMGRHHARVYQELPGADLVGIVDIDADRAAEIARRHDTTAYSSIEPLVGKVEALTVAVPTVAHVEVATPFIEAGAAVLIVGLQ